MSLPSQGIFSLVFMDEFSKLPTDGLLTFYNYQGHGENQKQREKTPKPKE